MKRRTRSTPLNQKTEIVLADGRVIKTPNLFRLENVEGNTRTGWYRFLYQRENGDLTFWGPCNERGASKGQAQFVSVTQEKVGKQA